MLTATCVLQKGGTQIEARPSYRTGTLVYREKGQQNARSIVVRPFYCCPSPGAQGPSGLPCPAPCCRMGAAATCTTRRAAAAPCAVLQVVLMNQVTTKVLDNGGSKLVPALGEHPAAAR